MKKIHSIKEHWRELFLSTVMGISLVAFIAAFIFHPFATMLLDGSCYLAFGFIVAFSCCRPNSLPSEKIWNTFGDTVTICLLLMFLTELIMAISCYSHLSFLEFWGFILALIVLYIVAFFFFVIYACDYKQRKQQQALSV